MNYELVNNYARVFLDALDVDRISDQILDNVEYLLNKFPEISLQNNQNQPIELFFAKEMVIANNLMMILQKNGRLSLLPEILQTLLNLYQERKRDEVVVYLAPGNIDSIDAIKDKAEKIINQKLGIMRKNIRFVIDHNLIWGFKIQVCDMVLDYSLFSMLKRCLK